MTTPISIARVNIKSVQASLGALTADDSFDPEKFKTLAKLVNDLAQIVDYIAQHS